MLTEVLVRSDTLRTPIVDLGLRPLLLIRALVKTNSDRTAYLYPTVESTVPEVFSDILGQANRTRLSHLLAIQENLVDRYIAMYACQSTGPPRFEEVSQTVKRCLGIDKKAMIVFLRRTLPISCLPKEADFAQVETVLTRLIETEKATKKQRDCLGDINASDNRDEIDWSALVRYDGFITEEQLDRITEDGISAQKLYSLEIGQIPLLTPKIELRLAQILESSRNSGERQRENQARERLVEANLRLVVSIARRFADSGLPLEDLVAEGNIGLLRAAEKFNWRFGCKFSTFATLLIKQAITGAIAEQGRGIRLPVSFNKVINRFSMVSDRLENDLGRSPTVEELAEIMGMGPEEIEFLAKFSKNALSLNQTIDEDEMVELGDQIVSPQDTAAEGIRGVLKDEISTLLQTLPPKISRILQLRFGLEDGRVRTLEETGAKLGLSGARIGQLEEKALEQLRTRLDVRYKLYDFLD